MVGVEGVDEDEEREHWAPNNLLHMLVDCVDDVSAYVLAANAFHPNELRACAGPLGIADDLELPEQTLATVIAARRLDTTTAAVEITVWARKYRTNRFTTGLAYLRTKGLPEDDR